MTNKLIKVDRVRSAREAAEVEELGADLVGVSLGTDPRFADDRTVTVEQAAEIGAALARATLVVAMELGRDRLARERPLVAGLDYTPENAGEILAAVPGLRGIALTLAGQARRGDARFHPYERAVEVLRALQQAG